uniref:Uncharacterized protein n=1 Tax=Arundo donax TaxID=35708 RepID=A0A0A9CXX9_ARUDO
MNTGMSNTSAVTTQLIRLPLSVPIQGMSITILTMMVASVKLWFKRQKRSCGTEIAHFSTNRLLSKCLTQ